MEKGAAFQRALIAVTAIKLIKLATYIPQPNRSKARRQWNRVAK